MRWRNSLDKIGIIGSFIAAACCLGLPAIVSIVTAVGLGFLIKDAVLLPLMIVFLALSILGLYLGFKVHGQPWPLILGSASSTRDVGGKSGDFPRNCQSDSRVCLPAAGAHRKAHAARRCSRLRRT